MLNKEILLKKIDKFLEKINYTIFIKNKLKELLLRYEFCRVNKSFHYFYKLEDININKFNNHLIGFIDGDGSLRSGKRTGHKKGFYRFVPNICIKLDGIDFNYLQLVVNKLDLNNKDVYNTSDMKSQAVINISSKEDIEKVMNLIEENGGFLSQKRIRDYNLLKKLLVYLNNTKLNVHNLTWVEKGMEIIKDLNTYNNIPNDPKDLEHIKKNLTWDYALGFIEAEGSLILHYNTKKDYIFSSFEITQNKLNNFILWGILDFIKNCDDPLIIKENVEINTKGIVEDKSKSRKQLLSRLTLTNNEVLFNKIIPLMLSSNLYSKMQINLVYWIFGVIICYKLKNINECKDLYFKLKTEINSNSNELLDLNEILDILNKYL